MIRLILVILFVILFLILSIPLQIIEYFIKKINPQAHDTSSLAIVNWAFRCVLFLAGTKITVIGREKIPTDTAVVYMPNHRSFFDIVITYPLVVGPTGFIAKDGIKKVPLLNFWMMHLNCLFLDRKNARAGMGTILEAIEQLKKGISIAIFPEGTRNQNYDSDELLEFHGGSFKVATKPQVPIVPVTIVGSGQILEAHFPLIKKANVIIEFGDPIQTADLDREGLRLLPQNLKQEIQSTYTKNKEMLAVK